MQICNGLGTTPGIQLLHDQIRLHPQQQGLTGVGTARGCPTLKSFRLQQGLRADLVMIGLEAPLRPQLKSPQSRSLNSRRRQAQGKQDCDGARDQDSGGRFAEMMPQYRLITPPCTPTGPPLPCCCSLRYLC